MPRNARLNDALRRGRGTAQAFTDTLRATGSSKGQAVAEALRGTSRGKALAVAGAAAALVGTGAGLAATAGSTPTAPTAAATRPAPVKHVATSDVAVKHATTAVKHGTPAVKRAVAVKHVAKPAAKAAPARHVAPAKAHALPAKPVKPYLIYDSVTPSQIPAHHEIATYATGGFAVPAANVAGKHVLWIDTNGSDPHAQALDVEPGDATPALAANWAQHKLNDQPGSVAHIYTMISEWPAVKAAVSHLPGWMHSHIRWWIADPTGVAHIVPGAQATQWYWGKNFDITTAKPSF
jgi:hypothetical protein